MRNKRRPCKDEFMRIVRAALDSHLPFQGSIRVYNFATVGHKSATVSLESLMGVPR